MGITEELDRILAYNQWANRRILDAAAGMSAEQLTEPIGMEVLSILRHIVSAQENWRRALTGEAATDPEPDLPEVAALRVAFDVSHTRLVDLIRQGLEWDSRPFDEADISVGTVAIQWHGHGVQHRAEAGMLLSMLGLSPGDLDFLVFSQTAS